MRVGHRELKWLFNKIRTKMKFLTLLVWAILPFITTSNNPGWDLTDPVKLATETYRLKITKIDRGQGTISFDLKGYQVSRSQHYIDGVIFWGITGTSHHNYMAFGQSPPNGWRNQVNNSIRKPQFGAFPKVMEPDWHLGEVFAGWRCPWRTYGYLDPNFCISFPGIHNYGIWWQVAIRENGVWILSDKWESTVKKL